jgi:hypothetical protein
MNIVELLSHPIWGGIGAIAGIAIGIIGFYMQNKNPVWLWVPITISAFIIGMITNEYVNQNNLNWSISVEKSDNPNKIDTITITQLTFLPPNEVVLKGQYKNLSQDQNIFVYLLATNKQYYFKDVQKRSDGVWISSKVDIGSPENFGGIYEAGILIGNAATCPELQDRTGSISLPTCAERVDWFTITR